MADNAREEMTKQVLTKDDGRTLIMYSFKPAKTQSPNKGDQAQ